MKCWVILELLAHDARLIGHIVNSVSVTKVYTQKTVRTPKAAV